MSRVLAVLAAIVFISTTQAQQAALYFPPAGDDAWKRLDPAAAGMNPDVLAEAVKWAQTRETDMPRDFSTQSKIFGTPLGPLPASRALTNGIILRRGYIVAEWGDTRAVDPSYSMAKSYLSMILGVTIDRGLIADIHQPVGALIHDGGYEGARNAKVTWYHHVTQTSEWEGEMFGKAYDFVGKEAFGSAARETPRELQEPGTHFEYNDVRMNRFSLSMLRLWKRPLPQVLKSEIMDPIGASSTWKWVPYDNATVDVDGSPMPSVSGGTRWGGGLWMDSFDHARVGLLMLRRGSWNGRQILSESWVADSTRPQGKHASYGYLWWLNTDDKPRWPDAPRESFSAQGAGENTIWVDPVHDLVVVWRWHKGGESQPELYRRILSSLTDATPER